jgi:hypothetical protein
MLERDGVVAFTSRSQRSQIAIRQRAGRDGTLEISISRAEYKPSARETSNSQSDSTQRSMIVLDRRIHAARALYRDKVWADSRFYIHAVRD